MICITLVLANMMGEGARIMLLVMIYGFSVINRLHELQIHQDKQHMEKGEEETSPKGQVLLVISFIHYRQRATSASTYTVDDRI